LKTQDVPADWRPRIIKAAMAILAIVVALRVSEKRIAAGEVLFMVSNQKISRFVAERAKRAT
jgi:hypothetical protein